MIALVSEILPITINFMLEESLEMKKMKPRKMSSHSGGPKMDYKESQMPCKGVWILRAQNGRPAEL